jgi:predicted HAD superfamily Cof-like phosphohydrolase
MFEFRRTLILIGIALLAGSLTTGCSNATQGDLENNHAPESRNANAPSRLGVATGKADASNEPIDKGTVELDRRDEGTFKKPGVFHDYKLEVQQRTVVNIRTENISDNNDELATNIWVLGPVDESDRIRLVDSQQGSGPTSMTGVLLPEAGNYIISVYNRDGTPQISADYERQYGLTITSPVPDSAIAGVVNHGSSGDLQQLGLDEQTANAIAGRQHMGRITPDKLTDDRYIDEQVVRTLQDGLAEYPDIRERTAIQANEIGGYAVLGVINYSSAETLRAIGVDSELSQSLASRVENEGPFTSTVMLLHNSGLTQAAEKAITAYLAEQLTQESESKPAAYDKGPEKAIAGVVNHASSDDLQQLGLDEQTANAIAGRQHMGRITPDKLTDDRYIDEQVVRTLQDGLAEYPDIRERTAIQANEIGGYAVLGVINYSSAETLRAIGVDSELSQSLASRVENEGPFTSTVMLLHNSGLTQAAEKAITAYLAEQLSQ